MIPPSVTPSPRDALFITGSGFLPAGEAQRQVLDRADDATFRAVFRTALARVSPEAKLPEPTNPLSSLASTQDAPEDSGLSLDADGEPELEDEDTDVLSLLAPLVIAPEPDAPTGPLSLDAATRGANVAPEGDARAASEASLRRSPSTLPAALLAPALVVSSLPTLPGPGPLATNVASSPVAPMPTLGRGTHNPLEPRVTTLHGVGPAPETLGSLATPAWKAPTIESPAVSAERPLKANMEPQASDHGASDARPTLRLIYESAATTSPHSLHAQQQAATPANDAVLDFQWPVNAELHVAAVRVTHQDAWRDGGLRLERELDRLRSRVFDGAERSPRTRADVATIAAALRPVVIQELAPRAVPASFAEPSSAPANDRGEDAALRGANDEARNEGTRSDGARTSRSFDRAASDDTERRVAEASVRDDRFAPSLEASTPLAEASAVVVPEMPARPDPTMPGMTTFAHSSPLREAISDAADQLARASHEMARTLRQQAAEEGANHMAVSHMVEARATLEDLGRVTVRVQPERDPSSQRTADTQSVRVTAERPETVELLHATKHDLLSDLQKTAPHTSSVSVGSDGASSHSHKQHSDRRDQGSATPVDYVMNSDSPLEAAVVSRIEGRVRIVL